MVFLRYADVRECKEARLTVYLGFYNTVAASPQASPFEGIIILVEDLCPLQDWGHI